MRRRFKIQMRNFYIHKSEYAITLVKLKTIFMPYLIDKTHILYKGPFKFFWCI